MTYNHQAGKGRWPESRHKKNNFIVAASWLQYGNKLLEFLPFKPFFPSFSSCSLVMSSSQPPSPLPPEQTSRLAAIVRPHGSSPHWSLTPQQLLHSASNKTAAHLIRATQHLTLAAQAAVVAAVAVGTGVDSAAKEAAARDLDLFVRAQKL